MWIEWFLLMDLVLHLEAAKAKLPRERRLAIIAIRMVTG